MATSTPEFKYGEDHLTAGKALAIAEGTIRGVLSEVVREKVNTSANTVKKIASGDQAVYGINTGFGPLCTTQISKDQTNELQKNLLMSHAVGLGAPIPDDISKLMMILKVHALAMGYSGVQEKTLDRIIWHID
ncbi:MAG: aromatic amino acid lyase, partial [Bacteroidota bacterium]